jgi:hypothetical protein
VYASPELVDTPCHNTRPYGGRAYLADNKESPLRLKDMSVQVNKISEMWEVSKEDLYSEFRFRAMLYTLIDFVRKLG